MKIITEQRTDDWIAYLNNTEKTFWEAGVTEQEAVEKIRISLVGRKVTANFCRGEIREFLGSDLWLVNFGGAGNYRLFTDQMVLIQ